MDRSLMLDFAIAGRKIGAGCPPYVVAELSANHGGQLERAIQAIQEAKRCGADAIKLQTYTPDTMTIDHDGPDFRISGGLWDGRGLYELYREAHTPWDWHEALFEAGRKADIPVFSTPFDATAVELLAKLGAPAFKIASFELVDHDLIRCVARTGTPTVMSTGMASIAEIGEALEVFRSAGGRQMLLLHCISGYPTPVAQSNLRRIPALAAEFGVPIGLSDHTLGVSVSIAAVALGACFIEKHFIVRRDDGGPDSTFSIEPDQLRALTAGAREAFDALGSGAEERALVETSNLAFRRSLYVVRAIKEGEVFTNENIRAIRPGFGLAPKMLPSILGKVAARDLPRGTRVTADIAKQNNTPDPV
jgi:pseudaminic acid synthase